MKKITSIIAVVIAIASLALASCGSAEKKTATAADVRPGVEYAQPTVLDFNATWCIPCKKLTPAFEQAKEQLAGKVNFMTVDIDQYPETAKAFGVEAVPCVVYIDAAGKATTYPALTDFVSQEQLADTLLSADDITGIILASIMEKAEANFNVKP